MNFYISDLHFGHKNIIKFDNRPFFTVSEMDEALIGNWNKTVEDDDTVYILGDLSWHKEAETLDILRKLKGRKVLIKGNHDRVSEKVKRKFSGVYDYLEIKDGKERVVMSHYPMLFWNGQFHDTVHLYGHVHRTEQYDYCRVFENELRDKQDIPMRMYNVGCMIGYMNYTPRTLEEILKGG